jgi:predicted phage terminase large subunit-like protein
MADKWPRGKILVEGKANGPAVIDRLKDHFPAVEEFDPRSKKAERIETAAEIIHSNKFFVPTPSTYPWVSEWMEDICGYPGRRYDDRPDALAQAILYWSKSNSPVEKLKQTIGWH